jgi:hypothetical protein
MGLLAGRRQHFRTVGREAARLVVAGKSKISCRMALVARTPLDRTRPQVLWLVDRMEGQEVPDG